MADFGDLMGNVWWIFIIFVLLISYWYLRIPKNLPPGPRKYPVIGSLLSIGKVPYLAFTRLGKKYGNVMHFYLGSKLVIVLNDFEAIKEAFVKQGKSFSARVEDKQFQEFEGANLGILFSSGEYWQQHRRFILSNLKNNGVGKLSLEPLIMNEIHHFMKNLKANNEKGLDMNILNRSVANNVFLLTTGQRFDYDDHFLIEITETLIKYTQSTQSFALLTFFPWVGHIPGIGIITNIEHRRQLMTTMYNGIKLIVKSALNQSEKLQDDIYAKAYAKEQNGVFVISRDMFMAGTETTSTSLVWLVLYMTFYPEIQTKVRDEIDRVIGGDREPSYNDRFNTPYTEATIMEVLRIVTITPLSIPHRNTNETTLFGYHIPKDTMILPNIYAVHHDPKLWGDPDNFRPERFIGDDGQLNKPDYYIPFGIGKRACVGEPLARMELYLYFVSMIQQFEVIPAKGVEQSLKAIESIVRQAACSTICLKQR